MSTHRFRSWLNETAIPFGKSLAVVLVFSPWLLVLYALITRHTASLDPNDREVISGFIEWFGTAYSFFLALAIVNVWSQFETVEREFDRELDAIATLLQTVRYTEASSRWKAAQVKEFKDVVVADIKNYLYHVLGNYKYEHLVPEQHRNGDRILESIGRHISSLTSSNLVPEAFITELFHTLNEAMDVRGDRISHSKPYTPVVVRLVAIAASLIWLLSFLALVIYDEWVATVLIGGVAFVIIMVLVIFFDLGEPFGGIWKIHLDDWQEFLWNMDHDDDPHIVFVYKRQNTVAGKWNSAIGRDTCKLFNLIHSKVPGRSWKQFVDNVERPRPHGHPRLKCLTFYRNQLDYNGLPIAAADWPVVALKRGGQREIFLDSREINRCQDWSEFETVFHQKLKEHLPWYEQ